MRPYMSHAALHVSFNLTCFMQPYMFVRPAMSYPACRVSFSPTCLMRPNMFVLPTMSHPGHHVPSGPTCPMRPAMSYPALHVSSVSFNLTCFMRPYMFVRPAMFYPARRVSFSPSCLIWVTMFHPALHVPYGLLFEEGCLFSSLYVLFYTIYFSISNPRFVYTLASNFCTRREIQVTGGGGVVSDHSVQLVLILSVLEMLNGKLKTGGI